MKKKARQATVANAAVSITLPRLTEQNELTVLASAEQPLNQHGKNAHSKRDFGKRSISPALAGYGLAHC